MSASRLSRPEPLRLMRSLNLVGLDFLDPIVLAALADERPLLLIGPHGSAKSELLNRLAAVLGLEHRHYNASLISFDDLLGYPVPDTAAVVGALPAHARATCGTPSRCSSTRSRAAGRRRRTSSSR